MEKAVLIINMPEKCLDCVLHEMGSDFNKVLCVPLQRSIDKFTKEKPVWCPLKPAENDI